MKLEPFINQHEQPGLHADEIHIWVAALDRSIDMLDRFNQIMSPKEHARAEQFHFKRDTIHYIARWGILRSIMGRYLSVDPGQLRFHHTQYGKPELIDASGLEKIHFNMSHSREMALFAFSRTHELGIDIEYIHDIPDLPNIIEISFSPKEKQAMDAMPAAERRAAFFRGWTCKEAITKALGRGLSLPLQGIEVSLAGGEHPGLLNLKDDVTDVSDWSLRCWGHLHDYACALAVKARHFETKYWQWRSDRESQTSRD
jgi:4'-phosphopantetheinyl transferase